MAVSWLAVIALAATALGASIAPTKTTHTEDVGNSTCGKVWITVHSPEYKEDGVTLWDAIELNWDFRGCSSVPSNIGLFDEKPSNWSNALFSYSIESEQGYLITNVTLGEPELPNGWNRNLGGSGPSCLWPWIAAGDDTVFIYAYSCLKIQPTWMEDHQDKIKGLRIGNLAIPGTHNAGSWRFDTELNVLARDSFVLCQDQPIWAQLVFGIRYFDFRVAYYEFYPNEEDRYWLNHNLIRVRPLLPLLKEIKAFLDVTKEVIFLDVHHLPIGFYATDGTPLRDVHNGLLKIVQHVFGEHIAPASEFTAGAGSRGPMLETFLTSNKRLVFSYVDSSIVSENSWLWNNVPQLWANTNNPEEMLTYLDQAIANSPFANARNPLYSAMAQTTPTVLDILFLRGSLRENADDVNRNVTERLATTWRNNANIVSSDFFLANDVIDQSILINLERATKL